MQGKYQNWLNTQEVNLIYKSILRVKNKATLEHLIKSIYSTSLEKGFLTKQFFFFDTFKKSKTHLRLKNILE